MSFKQAITRNNHYVPCMYLKRFASRPGWIYRYDILVPDERCPVWVEKTIARVASAMDLYTSLEEDVDADTHERWLNLEYEAPAEEAIERAVSGARMTTEHWRQLVRFLAVQDIRTPARLQESFARWQVDGAYTMQEGLEQSIGKFKLLRSGDLPPEPKVRVEPGFPMRVLIRPSSDPEMAEIKVETTTGRSLWLWEQRQMLNGIAKHLHLHQWTVLQASEGVTWPTSDNPVVRLNFHSDQKYDFKGGWGSKGTEIFMPLDPTHLLYTRIGQKRLERGTRLDFPTAERFGRIIREHAFRYIFSPAQDPLSPVFKPRHVNLEAYRHEPAEWSKWNHEQVEAERALVRPLPGG